MSELTRTAEAALMLIAAWLLVRFAPFGRWRRLISLGRVSREAEPVDTAAVEQVWRSIGRAERRILRRCFKCLPRAVAAHWMLARRGVATRVMIGAAAAHHTGPLRLHAWLEALDRSVIGEPGEFFAFRGVD